MKIVNGKHDVDFDNGVWIDGIGDEDCCASNYLDTEQFVIGDEYPDMTLSQLKKAIKVKDDGFILKDSQKTPKWCQARSEQNGYYSDMTTLYIGDKNKKIELARLSGEATCPY